MKKIALGLLFACWTMTAADAGVTFSKDVAPILYQRCVECHRQGEAAPMPLITYQEVRPWAKAIKDVVARRRMPPWLADARYGHFVNDRSLSQKEIDTLLAWVDGGSPKGDDADLPAAPRYTDGWAMGKPDAVISLLEDQDVPAEGVIAYRYVTVPTNFTEDKWVQAAEIRPGTRNVVHHVIVFIQEPGAAGAGEGRLGNKLVGFAPGEQPKVLPPGYGRLVKAGSKFIFQLHYTTNGKAAKDRSSVGLIFAKEPVERRVVTGTATNAKFVIPAGEPSHEVRSSWTAPADVRIVDLMPHMHVRGKDFNYTVVYPDGRAEKILEVPRYDFNWQLVYRLRDPLSLPKGSRIECVAHFDNSPNNKFNPDPTKEVKWGPQTWEEMMIGWFDYVIEDQKAATGAE